MKFSQFLFRIFDRARSLQVLAVLCLFLTGCAAKVTPPVYFPQAPSPPRVQLLATFNNQGSLRDNAAMAFLLGEETGDRFSKAYGMAFRNGQLYIADSGKDSTGVAIVDFEMKTVEFFGSNLRKPFNIAIDEDGTIYVTDIAENTDPGIVIFDSQHNYLKRYNFSADSGIRPISLLIEGDELYVCGSKNNQIHVLDKLTGNLLRSIKPDRTLGFPIHLAKAPEGNILVTETLAQTLSLLSPSGEILQQIGAPGDRAGTFTRPKATAVDRDGYVYAVDIGFQNVQIFNSEGRIMMDFGAHPDGEKTLIMPAGIAITYDRMDIFQQYAAPDFILDYVVAVSSQGSPHAASKVSLYGFGKLKGADYTLPDPEK